MKKILMSLLAFSFAIGMFAQNYDPVKNMVAISQFKKAKEELDKNMSNAKYSSKPEAYILKAATYAGLSMDPAIKGTPEGDQLTKEAEAAFIKYREMQPDLKLLQDPVYQTAPINLYSSFFSMGFKDYEKKNWQQGFETFKKVAELSDLLIKEKIISVPIDTNTLILAGVTAESSNHPDDAAKYYGRLADIKVNEKEYESIYRFLVNYYFRKKDIASFEKYKAIGKELYPKSEFFAYDKVDFAIGLEEDFNNKIKAVEEIIEGDPNNYKAYYLLGGTIYDTLNSTEEGAVQPANAQELEAKMIAALKKASGLQPNNESPYVYIGSHFITKGKRINDERKKHAADMKTRTKPGTKASAEDVQKRDRLDKLYGETLELAIEPYEKAAAIYATRVETLPLREKQQYRFIASDLGEIYGYKKTQAKGKPAEAAKYAAEEKKWNDLYEKLR